MNIKILEIKKRVKIGLIALGIITVGGVTFFVVSKHNKNKAIKQFDEAVVESNKAGWDVFEDLTPQSEQRLFNGWRKNLNSKERQLVIQYAKKRQSMSKEDFDESIESIQLNRILLKLVKA